MVYKGDAVNSAHSRAGLFLRAGFDPGTEDPSFEAGLGIASYGFENVAQKLLR